MQLAMRRIEQIKPNSRNARTHSARQIQQIAASIQSFGFRNPVLVDETNVIIAGHGRLAAAQHLGMTEIPVIEVEGLSKAQKSALALADNKIAMNAGWDLDLLSVELRELSTVDLDFELEATGRSAPKGNFGSNPEIPETERRAKSPVFAGLLSHSGAKNRKTALAGWRRSEERTRLQANSLLSGNLTGNFAGKQPIEAMTEDYLGHLQRLMVEFPTYRSREFPVDNRELCSTNREFGGQILKQEAPSPAAMAHYLSGRYGVPRTPANAAPMATDLPDIPIARRVAHSVTHHGVTVEDPYAWLRDPGYPQVNDPDVLGYLHAENTYFEAAMKPNQELIKALFAEMKGRVKDDDASVPQKDGAFVYWNAFHPGAEYRQWHRRPAGQGPDAVILDEPALAEGHEYFRLGGHTVSPDGRLLAYAVDTNGSERFVLKVRDLDTGTELPDLIENWRYGLVWAADSKSFLYTDADEHWRSKTVWHHRLGDQQSADRAIYRELDEKFGVSLGRSQSRAFAIISTGDHATNEVRLLPLDNFAATPVLVSARKTDRQYNVDEREGTLYIRVNDTHPNFRVVTAPASEPAAWTELIAGSDRHYIQAVTTFEKVLVVEERVDGLSQIRLHDYSSGAERYVAFPEASFVAALTHNPEYHVDRLRIGYQSMVTPNTVYDYHIAEGRLETLKVREIPSGYDASKYANERLMAPSRDGTVIPVSLVYRRDFVRDGTGQLHIQGYGAYGHAYPPGFSANRLSLLERGFACAIAHIRGGDDLGYRWYLDGKLEKRTNTFNDFGRHTLPDRPGLRSTRPWRLAKILVNSAPSRKT